MKNVKICSQCCSAHRSDLEDCPHCVDLHNVAVIEKVSVILQQLQALERIVVKGGSETVRRGAVQSDVNELAALEGTLNEIINKQVINHGKTVSS